MIGILEIWRRKTQFSLIALIVTLISYLVIMINGLGVGLNELVVSNVAIYYSNTEKRRDRAQSEKRQIRPTQKADKSYVIDMVTPKSPEEKMYKRLQDKEDKSMLLLKWGDLK